MSAPDIGLEKPKIVILITGSRKETSEDRIQAGIYLALDMARLEVYGSQIGLLHGDARGADRTAATLGADLGYRVRAYPANWDRDGKKAGPIRNGVMVRATRAAMDAGAVGVCVAYPLPDSIGTWDCIRQSHRAGIPVIVVPENISTKSTKEDPK